MPKGVSVERISVRTDSFLGEVETTTSNQANMVDSQWV